LNPNAKRRHQRAIVRSDWNTLRPVAALGCLARTALRQIVGNEIMVLPHQAGTHLVAKIGLDYEALMASGDRSLGIAQRI
jgi:hypothetical protein